MSSRVSAAGSTRPFALISWYSSCARAQLLASASLDRNRSRIFVNCSRGTQRHCFGIRIGFLPGPGQPRFYNYLPYTDRISTNPTAMPQANNDRLTYPGGKIIAWPHAVSKSCSCKWWLPCTLQLPKNILHLLSSVACQNSSLKKGVQ